jgi:hypothetical protein
MSLRPPPYWPCFASDWLAQEAFRLASLPERGLLWSMLNQAWVSDSLPREPTSIARLLGLNEQSVRESLSDNVMQFFKVDENGRIYCPELRYAKAAMLQKRELKSMAGKKGADARYNKASNAIAEPSAPAIAASEVKRTEVNRDDVRRNEKQSLETSYLSDEAKAWVDDYSQVQ